MWQPSASCCISSACTALLRTSWLEHWCFFSVCREEIFLYIARKLQPVWLSVQYINLALLIHATDGLVSRNLSEDCWWCFAGKNGTLKPCRSCMSSKAVSVESVELGLSFVSILIGFNFQIHLVEMIYYKNLYQVMSCLSPVLCEHLFRGLVVYLILTGNYNYCFASVPRDYSQLWKSEHKLACSLYFYIEYNEKPR